MITASEFLKWLEVFNVAFGPNTITVPVSLGQGGTGAVLIPQTNGIVYMNNTEMAYTNAANNAVLSTGADGVPSLSTTLPIGLTIPDYLSLVGGTMTGPIIASGLPTTDLELACKEYVDDVASGLIPTGPVQAASTVALDATYFNGPANDGKGATLTLNSTGTVTLDGVLTVIGQDYMIKDQVDTTTNGIYTCTTAGAIGVAGIFTRSTTFDTPILINSAGITPILQGTTLIGQGWYEVNTVNDIGTDPIVFIKFGNTGTVTSITAGTGLTGGTITNNGTIALDVPVTTVNGGTGLTTVAANGLLYASALDTWAALVSVNGGLLGTSNTGVPTYITNPAAANHILMSANAALSTWSTATYPPTTTANQLLYSSANNNVTGLATSNNGFLTTTSGGVPQISSLANIQNNVYNAAPDTGTTNSYLVALNPPITSYTNGLRVQMIPISTNTGDCSINVNGLGFVSINANGHILTGGEIVSTLMADLVYNSSQGVFELQNSQLDLPLNHNFCIGGNFDMNLWQRGTSFPSQANTSGQYNADMFYFAVNGTGTGTVAKTVDAPTVAQCGFLATNSMRFTVTTAQASIGASDYYFFAYPIEGYDWTYLARKRFTVDFWVKTTLTGIYTLGATNSGGDASCPMQYTVASSNTWEHKKVTFPASPITGTWNYTNGRGCILLWIIAAGSTYFGSAGSWNSGTNQYVVSGQVNGVATLGNIFAIDLVQIAQGTQYYPFISRPIETETALQQRYYAKSYAISTPPATSTTVGSFATYLTVANNAPVSIRFPVVMRSTPTVTMYSAAGTSGALTGYISGTDAGSAVIAAPAGLGNTGFMFCTSASGLVANTQYYGHYIADASL